MGDFEAFEIVGCAGRLFLFVKSSMVWSVVSLSDLVIGSVELG